MMIGLGAGIASTVRAATRNLQKTTNYKRSSRKHRVKLKTLPPEKRIPLLVKQLAIGSERRRDMAEKALVELTGHDFGRDAADWANWFARNRHLSRVDWADESLESAGYAVGSWPVRKLIPNLIAALRDGGRGVRAAASFRLKYTTGAEIHFPFSAHAYAREYYVHRWITWWTEERKRFLSEAMHAMRKIG